jgi:hypothetical protein
MDLRQKLLTKNFFSRPGKGLESVKGIVIHFGGKSGGDIAIRDENNA